MTTPQLDFDWISDRIAERGWRPIWIVESTDPEHLGVLVPQTGSTGRGGVDMPRPFNAVTLSIGCPDGVFMFDVDQYEKDGAAKTGAETMEKLVAELGPLPPTVKITSRGPADPGGKLPYRIPLGTELKGTAGKDIEILQRHHRFTWAPWTLHPRTSTVVAVYGPDDQPAWLTPVNELPELPAAWLNALMGGGAGDGDRLEIDIPDDGVTTCTQAAAWLAAKDFGGTDPRGVRANTAVNYLKNMAATGHYVGPVIDAVREELLTTGDGDWDGMWSTAKVKSTITDPDLHCCGRGIFGADPPSVTQMSSGGLAEAVVSEAFEPSVTEPFTDEGEANRWAAGLDAGQFVDSKDGLLSLQLGAAVTKMGPLGAGTDNRIWSYRHGVYRPEPNVVQDRCVRLLKDKYRGSYATNAEHVARVAMPVITSDPVEQYLNVPNGLLDWRTGELYAHSPGILSTVQLGVPWVPDATCPTFDWWLPQVVPSDCVELVWELIGYLAYSGNPLHAAIMFVGDGRNGKGTLLRVIRSVLGPANLTAVSLADLVSTRFTTAALFGKLANIAGDIDATYMENTAVFKAITGGDMISAEHKGRDRFDFTPWAVPVFSANKIPASADTTAGYLSRWTVLPFPNSFEGKEDRTLDARLAAELPGVLAQAVRRLAPLLARGQFGLTDSAREAKADFSRKVDQVRYWVHECCELGDHPPVVQARLNAAYKRWVQRDDGRALKASEFYSRLAAMGVEQGYGPDGSKVFRGIKVVDECIQSFNDYVR